MQENVIELHSYSIDAKRSLSSELVSRHKAGPQVAICDTLLDPATSSIYCLLSDHSLQAVSITAEMALATKAQGALTQPGLADQKSLTVPLDLCKGFLVVTTGDRGVQILESSNLEVLGHTELARAG